MRDVQQRLSVLETRFGAMEARINALSIAIDSRFTAGGYAPRRH